MTAFYNEIEPFAVQWLRNLSDAGHIAAGAVDPRSIADVQASDVAQATQAHFFAGIGVWSHALRLAGWPDARRVWTGSCPCQPFSAAGKRGGFDDARHLWPEWFRLIAECRPAVVFGEQVASADGLKWLDAVSADLEGAGYAFGAADLCAAGVGAPHIRQRLFFVAVADADRIERRTRRTGEAGARGDSGRSFEPERLRNASGVANANREGLDGERLRVQRRRQDEGLPEAAGSGAAGRLGDSDADAGGRQCGGVPGTQASTGGGMWSVSDRPRPAGAACELGDADRSGLEGWSGESRDDGSLQPSSERASGATRGFWADAEWLACRDGKFRPAEPGTFPLASGVAARVGKLRAIGNAIVAPAAATFVRAAMDWIDGEAAP